VSKLIICSPELTRRKENMKIRTTIRVASVTLIVIGMIISIVGGMTGCKKTGEEKSSVIEVEKIIDFTGSIRITLPSGDIRELKVGEKIPPLPEKTLIEVLSKECTGVLSGNIITLKAGQIARIVRPGVTAQKVIQFTGELKIVLPDGTIIFVKAGEPLPILPPGTMIEVISGDLIVLWEDERITLTPGDVAWFEPIDEAIGPEVPDNESGDISPASPFEP
jgi:hypothetical protein